MGKYAIMLVLSLTFSITAYNWGIRNTGHGSEMRKTETFSHAQARNIAQSAAQVALAKILDENDVQFNPSANSSVSYPVNQNNFAQWADVQGSYRFNVTNHGDSLLVLNTIGSYGNETYGVTVTMNMTAGGVWNPQFPLAVFAEEDMELTGSSRIVGHAGTNSVAPHSVRFGWSTGVDSSFYVGPGGDPSAVIFQANFQQGNVGGQIHNLNAPMIYPMPEFPPMPPKNIIGASIHVSSWPPFPPLHHTIFDNIYIPELRITGNTTLTLVIGSGHRTLHVGKLDIQQGHIVLDGSGTLDIYVENEIVLNGSSTINNGGSIDDVFIFYKGSPKVNFGGNTRYRGGLFAEIADLTLAGSNVIQGHVITGGSEVIISGNAEAYSRVVYAPNADVELNGSGRIRGAVIGKTVKMVGNTRVFYNSNFDTEIPDLSGVGGTPTITISSWN